MAHCAHFFGSLESEARVLRRFCAGLVNQTEYSDLMKSQSHMENNTLNV